MYNLERQTINKGFTMNNNTSSSLKIVIKRLVSLNNTIKAMFNGFIIYQSNTSKRYFAVDVNGVIVAAGGMLSTVKCKLV